MPDSVETALVGGKHVAWYTLSDLDELLSFIAAEANHSTDKKIRKGLDAIYARLRREMESYDDGLWQGLSNFRMLQATAVTQAAAHTARHRA